MNEPLLRAMLAEYNETDPIFASKPYHYESTSRQERAHLRTLPGKTLSLPKLNLGGFVSFRTQQAVTPAQACCPAAAV